MGHVEARISRSLSIVTFGTSRAGRVASRGEGGVATVRTSAPSPLRVSNELASGEVLWSRLERRVLEGRNGAV